MELSKRLRAVAHLVTPVRCVADIGCDHGYVSVWLVRQGICSHVIAMDINRGPLEKAEEHITAYGLTDYIETRRSDGARELRIGEADALVMAGMGGRLMLRILSDSKEVTQAMREWVLQPQSETALVRRTLRRQGHRIVEESIVLEENKFYPMFRVVPCSLKASGVQHMGGEPEQDSGEDRMFDQYGRLLLEENSPTLQEYLDREEEKLTGLLRRLEQTKQKGIENPDIERPDSGPDRSEVRVRELKQELELLTAARAYCSKAASQKCAGGSEDRGTEGAQIT